MKGSKLALRFQHKMSVSMREKIQKGLQKNKFVTLMIMLFVPKLRFFAPAVAAVMKINYKLFLFVDLLAVLLYVALYMAIGWLFHDQLNRVLNKMHMLQHFIFIGLMVVLAIFLMWKVIKAFTEKHFHKKKKPASK
jgi:membrane protein DedA with SNARE-associated domain